jgi:phenylacetate-CoA ligase
MSGERFFEPEVETMPREQIRANQRDRILELVPYAYEHSAFYREVWDAHGVRPRDIRTLEDFSERVPFIDKDMIRAYRARTGDPFGGLLCVPQSDLVSVTSSSGTTGDPEFFAEVWQDSPPLVTHSLRDLWGIGLRPGERVITPPMTFRNLMDFGYQALGAVVVNVDCWFGKMAGVIEAVQKYRPTYLQFMYPQLVELQHLAHQYDLKEAFSSLKGAGCAGQPISRRMRAQIKDDWGIQLFEYTSAADTGTAWECVQHDGFHLWEDTVLPECVDSGTGVQVAEGDLGELVATDLDNMIAPLIRYRSGDLTRQSTAPCGCGRTHGRMWVAGRLGDETIVAGRSVALRDIWQAVEDEPETAGGVFQLVRAQREVDELRVRVGYDPEITSDSADLARRLAKAIEESTGVQPELEMFTEEEIMMTSRSVAKLARVVKS